MSLTQILNSLSGLTEEQLLMVNSCAITEIKSARKRKVASIKSELAPGDRVTFTGRKRGRRGVRFPVTGKLTKVKRKNAEVLEEGTGLTWNVSISMLQKLK